MALGVGKNHGRSIGEVVAEYGRHGVVDHNNFETGSEPAAGGGQQGCGITVSLEGELDTVSYSNL